jgi:hypothetical protein
MSVIPGSLRKVTFCGVAIQARTGDGYANELTNRNSPTMSESALLFIVCTPWLGMGRRFLLPSNEARGIARRSYIRLRFS